MNLKNNFNGEKSDDGSNKRPRCSIEEEVSNGLMISSDVVLKIFVGLPPKSLFKFKCVSKEICNLIEKPIFIKDYFRRFQLRKPVTGFFYQIPGKSILNTLIRNRIPYSGRREEHSFVATYSDAGNLPDSSLRFMKENKALDYIELLDSSNGLLLCKRILFHNPRATYHVCNPRTMENVAIPCPVKKNSIHVFFGLLALFTVKGFMRYMVICISRGRDENPFSELSIFSSETGEWKEFEDRLPVLVPKPEHGSKVVVKDILFWDCFKDEILVCYYENSSPCFSMINAPKAQVRRCLWNYNEKLLCYCHEDDEEFPAWSLCFNGDNQFDWKEEDPEGFLTLAKKVSIEHCGKTNGDVPEVLPRVSFRILAYDPYSNIIYLCISDSIYSFGFTDCKFEQIFTSPHGMKMPSIPISLALAYVHCFMPIEIPGKYAQLQPNET